MLPSQSAGSWGEGQEVRDTWRPLIALSASASSSAGPSSHLSQASPALCSKSKNAHPASVILGFLMYSLGMIKIVSLLKGLVHVRHIGFTESNVSSFPFLPFPFLLYNFSYVSICYHFLLSQFLSVSPFCLSQFHLLPFSVLSPTSFSSLHVVPCLPPPTSATGRRPGPGYADWSRVGRAGGCLGFSLEAQECVES